MSGQVETPSFDLLKTEIAKLAPGTGEVPTLDSTSLKNVVAKLASDPDGSTMATANAMANIDPETSKKIRAMAQKAAPQQQQIREALGKKGISVQDAHAMKKEMKQSAKIARSNPLMQSEIRTFERKETYILLTAGQRIKKISLTLSELTAKFQGIAGLEQRSIDNSISMYYDSHLKGKNKKATSLLGSPVGGDVYLHRESPPLTVEEIEKLLRSS